MDIIKTAELEHVMRLAAKARAEGVRLYVDRRDGRHFASSVSHPGTLHYVTGYSCDCRGFATHQRCKHLAALLSALGWLPGTPEPDTAPMTITCAHVDGHYSLDRDPQWMEPFTEILVDGEVKIRIVGDTCQLAVHWIENGRPIDDLTGCTPSMLDHFLTVDYWIRSLDDRVPAHVPMQAAGLFRAGEFVDAEMVAA